MIDSAMKTTNPAFGRSAGFTLIELLIAIAIVGILTAIAVPSYREYLRRGAVEDGLANISSGRVAIEQYFLDNRTFVGAPCPTNTDRFAMTCAFAAATYTITATGSGNVATFIYTLDQSGARTTAGAWGSGACWISRKGGAC